MILLNPLRGKHIYIYIYMLYSAAMYEIRWSSKRSSRDFPGSGHRPTLSDRHGSLATTHLAEHLDVPSSIVSLVRNHVYMFLLYNKPKVV